MISTMVFGPIPLNGVKSAFKAVKQDISRITEWIFYLKDNQVELRHRVEKIEAKLAEIEREKLLR